MIEPNTLFEDRLNQMDLRVTRRFQIGRTTVRGNFDIYNMLNGASILSSNAGYGSQWLTPYELMGGRLYKFSAQFEF